MNVTAAAAAGVADMPKSSSQHAACLPFFFRSNRRDTMAEEKRLHIISWNVAGWDATLKYIKSHYNSVDAFLDRLGCDILAIQEAKVQKAKLSENPAAASAHPFGDWESFWAVPSETGKSVPKRGFNGVTTFARKGLTLAADACPLGDASLDGEGRCLLTDHGGFVLLNVYAHATGEGDDYAKKLRHAGRGALLPSALLIELSLYLLSSPLTSSASSSLSSRRCVPRWRRCVRRASGSYSAATSTW